MNVPFLIFSCTKGSCHKLSSSPSLSPFLVLNLIERSPARALETSGIPFVVFGEDALSFVHFVPTGTFDFTVLVPDELVQAATEHLQKALPQYVVTQERPFGMVSEDGVCALPRAVRLQWDSAVPRPEVLSTAAACDRGPPSILDGPGTILVVPESHFHFDVRDMSRSCRLVPPVDPIYSNIRFPTMPAFLDALIDTMFEPVDGVDHSMFRIAYLHIWLSYLVIYNVRDEMGCTAPGTEDLLPPAKVLLDGLKLENCSLYGDVFAHWLNQNDT